MFFCVKSFASSHHSSRKLRLFNHPLLLLVLKSTIHLTSYLEGKKDFYTKLFAMIFYAKIVMFQHHIWEIWSEQSEMIILEWSLLNQEVHILRQLRRAAEKIGSSLIPNHHNKGMLVQIPDTQCISDLDYWADYFCFNFNHFYYEQQFWLHLYLEFVQA